MFVSFQSGNDDIFKPKKMNLVNGKNLMRILRLMTKDRNFLQDFQKKSEIQADSPTGSNKCFHLILAIIASKQSATPNLIEIKAAFMQGHELNQDVYTVPPPEPNVTGKL